MHHLTLSLLLENNELFSTKIFALSSQYDAHHNIGADHNCQIGSQSLKNIISVCAGIVVHHIKGVELYIAT
jgi:hypothetical protein